MIFSVNQERSDLLWIPQQIVAESGLVPGFLLPWPRSAWPMQLQVVVDVGLVVTGISASFSFIRSLGATFFLGDDYMFLKPN